MSIGTFTNPASINIETADESYRQLLRAKCRESLYFLCKAILGFKDFTPSIHGKAANFVQNQGFRRKLLMLPRGFMKSHLATIGYPIWLTIQEPNGRFRGADERILIANAVSDNSEHFLAKIKSVYERNAVFQWLFPDLIPDFGSRQIQWNVTEATIPRTVTYPEPTFSAMGVGGAVVSRHYTRIILDDLINEKHTESPELMRKTIDWYKYTESLLEVTGRDEITVIGTRWSFNDLYSHIRETEGEYSAGNPLGYASHIRSAIEDDKAIFPDRFDFKELSRLREKYSEYMFSCLYLNDPRQPGVNDFNENWLQYYTFTEAGKIKLSDNTLIDPNDLDRVAIIDIAVSMRRDADFSAVVVVGVDPARRVFLLDAWHGRVNTRNLIEKIFAVCGKWHVRACFYEDSAQQKLIEYSLKEYTRETGQYLNIQGVKAGNTKTKEQRIRLVAPYFNKKMVYIRTSHTDFVNEYKDFPLGKHDDLLDAFAYFPRVVRWSYDDLGPSEEKVREEDMSEAERRFEMDTWLRGRSAITGY